MVQPFPFLNSIRKVPGASQPPPRRALPVRALPAQHVPEFSRAPAPARSPAA